VEDLDRHVPVHIGLLCAIDRTHPALPYLLDDAELTGNLFA
jgi:hypothetical protein